MKVIEEMAEIDRESRSAVLPILGRYVHIDEIYGRIIIVNGFLGDEIEDVLAKVGIWFYAQGVFSKLVLTCMNGVMTVTFDKDKYGELKNP